MNSDTFSYRFANEIINHPNYSAAITEIMAVVDQCPIFTWPGKSANRRLNVVQQLLNTFFDRRLAVDLGWEFHPAATRIPNSGLAADYRKNFNGLRIQAEIQFGNMSRWYSDIFKFQTAYSQDLIDMGLCIVPKSALANRIDSNVTNFERCIRELPSAKLSISLPILIIGLYDGPQTTTVDASTSQFANIGGITGAGNSANLYRIVNGHLLGTPINAIDGTSPTGGFANAIVPAAAED